MAAKYLMHAKRGGVVDSGTLNPSKDPTGFASKYESVSVDEKKVLPVTKVEFSPSDSTSNPKHIYVNVSSQNMNTAIGIPAQFQIEFDQPYLKNVEKYYLTIVKASFPTTSIPLFNFGLTVGAGALDNQNGVIIRTQAFPNGFGAILRPVNIPEIATGPLSLAGRYNVYYYQQFLDSLNMAIMDAFNALIAADSILPSPTFAGTVAPFVVFDSQSLGFKLVAQKDTWSPEVPFNQGGAKLYINFETYRLFNAFPSCRELLTGPIGQGTEFINLFIEERNGNNQTSGSYGVNPMLNGTMSNLNGGLNLEWKIDFRYNMGSVISYGLNYYGSLLSNNIAQQPDISPLSWQLISTIALNSGTASRVWDVIGAYVIGQIVYYPSENSVPYVSLVNANVGNVPDLSPAQWKQLGGGGYPTVWNSTIAYVIGQNVYYPSSGPSGVIYTAITNNTGSNPGNIANIGVDWEISSGFESNMVNESYSTTALWPDLESIVIQSGSLPIRYEVYAPPNSDVVGSGSQVPRPILTDIDPYKQVGGFDRTPIQYTPPGNYRLIDLFSKSELKRIDAFIQYKRKDLSFVDLIMLPGDYFSIKFLFVRNDALSIV